MKKLMKVTYATGCKQYRPMIRITNNTLTAVGFGVGTAIEVSYQPNIITINKIK